MIFFFSGFLVEFQYRTPRGQVSSSSFSFVSVRLKKKTPTFIDFCSDLLKVAPPALPPYRRSKALLIQVEGAKKVIPRDLARSRAVQTARPERALGTVGEPHRVKASRPQGGIVREGNPRIRIRELEGVSHSRRYSAVHEK